MPSQVRILLPPSHCFAWPVVAGGACGRSSMVELQPSKLVRAGFDSHRPLYSFSRLDLCNSSGRRGLVFFVAWCSGFGKARFFEGRSSNAAVAQSVECVLGKDEVMGSNPISSSWLG